MARAVDRRSAIALALIAAAFGAGGISPAAAGARSVAPPRGGTTVAVGALISPGAARAIGVRAAGVVCERSSVALVRALERDLATLAPSGGEDREDIAALRHRIGRLVAADFVSGRIVSVDGWQLSLTEARLCALVACAGAGRTLRLA